MPLLLKDHPWGSQFRLLDVPHRGAGNMEAQGRSMESLWENPETFCIGHNGTEAETESTDYKKGSTCNSAKSTYHKVLSGSRREGGGGAEGEGEKEGGKLHVYCSLYV